MASIKLWEVRVNLRVHKNVSRIGLIRSDYYTTSIFGSIGRVFAPDPSMGSGGSRGGVGGGLPPIAPCNV